MTDNQSIDDLLQLRFDDAPQGVSSDADSSHWHAIANHQSCRLYDDKPVQLDLVRQLCALALSSPTKSDLQQRDIIIVSDPDKRATINALFPGSPWIAGAPVFVIFCGNNRRLRQIHERHGHPFENDHLDAFFNAAVDAGIALSAFALAADAAGLGTCPISTIRDHLETINELLELPDWVFPVAGMTLGWPSRTPRINLRLPLDATVHTDTYNEAAQWDAITPGPKTKPANTPNLSARISAPTSGRRASNWTDPGTFLAASSHDLALILSLTKDEGDDLILRQAQHEVVSAYPSQNWERRATASSSPESLIPPAQQQNAARVASTPRRGCQLRQMPTAQKECQTPNRYKSRR